MTGVVVPRVELVADEGGATSADILDLGQLRVRDDASGRVSRVRCQNDRGSAGDFLGDLVRVNMVAILIGERDGDRGELGRMLVQSQGKLLGVDDPHF